MDFLSSNRTIFCVCANDYGYLFGRHSNASFRPTGSRLGEPYPSRTSLPITFSSLVTRFRPRCARHAGRGNKPLERGASTPMPGSVSPPIFPAP